MKEDSKPQPKKSCVGCGKFLTPENALGVLCVTCAQSPRVPALYCYMCGEEGVIKGTIYCKDHQ